MKAYLRLMSSFSPLQLTFTEDWRGYTAFIERGLDQYPAMTRLARWEQWFRFTSSLPFLILLFAVFLAIFAGVAPKSWPYAVILALMAWVMYYVWILTRPRPWIKYVKDLQNYPRQWASAEKHEATIRIDEEGVTFTSDQRRETIFWSIFDDIITLQVSETVYVLLTYAHCVKGVCFPRSALGDDSQANAAIASIRELMIAKGVHESVRVRQILADEHFVCRCGHDLYGLTSGRCPECGTRWTHLELRLEQAERQYRQQRWALMFSPSVDINGASHQS